MTKGIKKLVLWRTAAAVVWTVYIFAFVDKMPFDDLQRSEIKSAKVTLLPPGETVSVSDIEEMTEILQKIRVTRRSVGIYFSGGQAVTVVINFTDGEIIEFISFGNSYLVRDGRYYRADYDTSEVMNKWANSLLEV